MKIAQIGANLIGAQKIIEEGIHELAIEEGHDSRILYVRGYSDLPCTIRCENRPENLMSRILRKFVGKNPKFAYLQTKRIIRILQIYQPDIVHLHILHCGYTDYPVLLKYLAKKQIPVVYTMHDMWAQTGGCYHFSDCKGYTTGCSVCPLESKQLDEGNRIPSKIWIKKRNLLLKLKSLHCVAVSQWVADEFHKGFLKHCPISVIYNGVERQKPDHLPLQKQKNNGEKIQIICVAISWGQEKGFDILVELAQLLGDSFEMLIVGNVDETLKQKNPGNMVFYGLCINREELFSLFQNADIHVTASKAETFGMTMVESAMAGIRTIGFNKTAIGEVLAQVYGVSVDDCTADGLYRAVVHMVKTNSCKLTAEEIESVYRRFSIRRMAEEYLKLYQNILENA